VAHLPRRSEGTIPKTGKHLILGSIQLCNMLYSTDLRAIQPFILHRNQGKVGTYFKADCEHLMMEYSIQRVTIQLRTLGRF
jgi:hypothetical protein